MSKSFKALGLAVSALALTQLPAAAQTKVTNEGISATEIVDRHPSGSVRPDQGLGRSGFQRHEDGGRGDQRRRRHQRPQDQADPRGQRLRSEERRAGVAEDGRARQDLRHGRPDGLADRARRAGHPVRRRRAAAVSADGRRIHLQVRSGQAAGAAEVQQSAALCREHARRGQIHDGAEEFQEALHHASGRRVRKERARRLHPAARRDEGDSRLRSRATSAAPPTSARRSPR